MGGKHVLSVSLQMETEDDNDSDPYFCIAEKRSKE